jgi:pimeloyl-ACP methyl ester carboxylesterase
VHGEGEPVLMIMGLGGSSKAWYRLLPHVAERHQAIVFDNRGTGQSDRVSGLLRMEDLVRDALAVLDAAGHRRAHVLGASMGGMIAQHVALDHRERVRSLILCCTAPVGRSGIPPWRLLASAALRPIFGAGGTHAIVAPALYAKRTREEQPDRVAADLEVRQADATPPLTLYAQLAAIAGHDTRHRLSELRGLPTTVVHGEEDSLVPPDRGRALADAIPGARLVLLPGAAHLLTVDAEEESAAAVHAHLDAASAALAAHPADG